MRHTTTFGKRTAVAALLSVLFLAPTVLADAPVWLGVNGTALPADAGRRNYLTVVAANSDPTIGDMIVLVSSSENATGACLPGCPRDVHYRAMHSFNRLPTVADASGALARCGALANVAAWITNLPACQSATDPILSDRPVADSPTADERDAFTDGRFVVYSTGPVGANADVHLVDLRNPDTKVVVAATSAHETPFGVAGSLSSTLALVGVRTTLPDGRVSLSLVNPYTQARAELATVNASNKASMGRDASPLLRVAWDAGSTLFVRNFTNPTDLTQGSLYYRFLRDSTISNPAVYGNRISYIETTACLPGGGSTCYQGLFPPRTVRVKHLDMLKPQSTHLTVAESGPTSLPTEVAQSMQLTFVRVTTTATTGAVTEDLDWFDMRDGQAASRIPTEPCNWKETTPGQLGMPSASFHYLVQLDYRTGSSVQCMKDLASTSARPTVKAWPMVYCSEPTSTAGTTGLGRCYGVGGQVGPSVNLQPANAR